MTNKSTITKEKDKITIRNGKTEITHNNDEISVSAPSIVIQESGR